MSRTREEILQGLKKLSVQKSINVPAKVKAVNEKEQSCTVEIDNIEYEDIRLTSVIDNDNSEHSFVVPVVGSWVIVAFVENSETDAFVIAYSKILKLILNADLIEFNKGEFHGLVKVKDLTKKLNTIEKDINNLKQALSTWVPVPQDGGAALKSTVASWAGQKLQETKQKDIENEKIKH